MKFDNVLENVRIDVFLSKEMDCSRTKASKLIKDGKVLVNGKRVASSYRLSLCDVVSVSDVCDEVAHILPEEMDLDIVYEDDYLAIVNKMSGVVVHPAVGNWEHTLVNGLLHYFNVSSFSGVRPFIVHRLDKDTSGLMVVAKDDKTSELLSNMIKDHRFERKYLALVNGVVKHDKGTIDAPIGRDVFNRQKFAVTDVNSKDAVTHFRVIERFCDASLICCVLETGRTHQIRVHMAYIGHSIVNDPLYGSKKVINDFGQMLHSVSIRFVHPITGEELFFEKEPPKEFFDILDLYK